MSMLIETFKSTTMKMLATYCQQYMNANWENVWKQHLPETERIFAKNGDSAYGFFCIKLFHPLVAELAGAGLTPRPILPGSFVQSDERWGPPEDRERRFWSVICQTDGRELGTLVTRIFHDHTRLRIPRPPQIYSISVTDHTDIPDVIIQSEPNERKDGFYA
ncbi:DUF6022 family protein [Paenibacillus harenae]|uniref:Uncharacterized protein n=1 Tax=Paenibacillus harenae TaxID=306543 RepID=A0ABT9U7V9_PAEHA|nr:DUF6022 family protein [Paenibacillus harenae]MDQ0115653.1 hypothetical protein [Paenibacillus harenae]